MNLYERDYTQLTEDEDAEWRALQKKEIVDTIGSMTITKSLFRDYPKGARHHTQLFPNNYLDIVELQDAERLNELLQHLQDLLDENEINERAILNFINSNCAYFIVGSILKSYFHFGHHEAHLFVEFPLGTSYQVDYLLVGKSSGGWEFVFVELESPNGGITLKGGDLGASIRKGVAQIADWDAWLDAHFATLLETFNKHKRPDVDLPHEFISMDTSRIHYVVVAGRRHDFNEKTYRIQRKKWNDDEELILHYDNLVDASRDVIGALTY